MSLSNEQLLDALDTVISIPMVRQIQPSHKWGKTSASSRPSAIAGRWTTTM